MSRSMDGLRNHGPLGLDMLKAPPLREKNNCALAKHAHPHTNTIRRIYIYFTNNVLDLTVELDTLAIVLGK